MKSSFESKKHREVRRTKEALRAHVITGRIPERVIGILIAHGCARPFALMENIFTGELTVTQRGIIREISKKSPGTIPPVIPPQKPEKPKHSAKHTPPSEPTVLKRIAQGAPASTPYSDEGGIERSTTKIKFDVLFLRPTTGYVDMVEIAPETLEQITMLMAYGHLDIVKYTPHSDLCIVNYQHHSSGSNLEYSGRLDEVIPQLINDLGIDTIPANPETEVPAGRSHFSAPTKPEALPQGHVRISLGENPKKTSTGGIIVTEKTGKNIELLKEYGTVNIQKEQFSAPNQIHIHFVPDVTGSHYPGSLYRRGNIDEGIDSLVQELSECGILPPEKTESQKPSTVRIHLSTLTVCKSNNPDEGVEVSLLTLGEIEELQKIGILTVTKNPENDYFRCRLAGRTGGGGPWVGTNQKLEFAIAVLIDQLRHAGKYPANPEQVETPSDTVNIDIDDVQECTGTGEGVVPIPRETWRDMVTLKKISGSFFQIYKEETEGLFTVNFYDPLQYATMTDVRGSIKEAVAQILEHAQNCGYYDRIVGNKYGYRGPDILDD